MLHHEQFIKYMTWLPRVTVSVSPNVTELITHSLRSITMNSIRTHFFAECKAYTKFMQRIHMLKVNAIPSIKHMDYVDL